MITKHYCWNLKLEKVSIKFLLGIFALDFYPWFGFEWELKEINKTFLGFRKRGSSSAAMHTAIVGNFQTNKEQIWFFFFLKGSSGCEGLIELLVLGQFFNIMACGVQEALPPGNDNWSLQLSVSSQTSEFTLAKKCRFKDISGEIWFH